MALWLYALALVWASLGWTYTRDTPLLNYVGFLIWEHGFAPYRDVFETSMPGTLAFHSLVAGAGLASDLGFVLLTLVVVVSFSVLGALVILPFGVSGTLVAIPLLVIAMLLQGPGWILKIDMVVLLPLAAALALAVWRLPRPVLVRQFLIGALFGLAGTMKPHFVLGAPIVVLMAYTLEHWSGRFRDLPAGKLPIQIATSLSGFAVPMLLMLIWLVSRGAFEGFVFVVTEYLPLHLEKTDWQEFVSPERKREIALGATLRFGGHYLLVPMAALAPLIALMCWRRLDGHQVIILVALCLLAVFYGLSPAIVGQFYVYYYFPFFFFSLLLIAISISLVGQSNFRAVPKSIYILFVAGFLVFFGGRFYFDGLFHPPGFAQLARMEEELKKWVPEGGRVQPIDWTSGVVHAMLRQKVMPATPYLYDYHFHHHVGGDINTGLRREFMEALKRNPPEVFMEANEFPRVSGLNTSESFPARDAFLAQEYRLVTDEEAFRVYLRRDLSGQ